MRTVARRGWLGWAVGLAVVGLALGVWGVLTCPSALAQEGGGEPPPNQEIQWTLTWAVYDQNGGSPLSANPGAKGGLQIFPGKQTDNDAHASDRRKVFAVITWGDDPAKIGVAAMIFKLWDVDDPSYDQGVVDNDTSGPDNRDDDYAIAGGNMISVPLGTIKRFAGDPGSTSTGSNLTCMVAVRVGMRPGDNYRVAAVDDQHVGDLAAMTQDEADRGVCHGEAKISEMLTVWRKLHLELDSMAAGEDNPITNKNIDKTWPDDPHPGESTAEINGFEPNDDGRYEGGTLTVTGGGGPYDIIDNWDPWLPGDDYVCVEGDITGDEDKPASFGDDDVCPLPRKADWSLVNEKFAPAYIEAVEEPGVYNPDVPFNPTVLNVAEVVEPLARDKKNRNTSADYWVSLILSCHQGKIETGGGIKTSVDGDPDLYYHVHLDSWKEGDQDLLWGCSVPSEAEEPEWGQNISLVFLEACRESEAQYQQSQTELWPEIKIPRNITAKDEEQITVVHELGWVFGWEDEEGPPGTPMQYGAFPSMNFNEDQIKCFRESKEIEK